MHDNRRDFTELSWLEIAHVFAELVGAHVVVDYTSGYSCSVDYHYTTRDGVKFFHSANDGTWMCENVPFHYIVKTVFSY